MIYAKSLLIKKNIIRIMIIDIKKIIFALIRKKKCITIIDKGE